MSMTYWLISEHGTANHEDDLHGLYFFQLNLDALCTKLGIMPLSEYLDDTELLAVLDALARQIQSAPDCLYDVAAEDFDEDDDACDCDDGCCAGDDDYDDEDGDIIELTPELVLADIAALKPVLQQAIASGEKVHLRLLG